ncbi:hypothetical protein BS78_K233500 [Paspalum vaginatum]|uniref:Uncharacterized protein n=1 Tax=Paspalum vaginatum TaxID=158149 RepID=A0A9W7XEA6_9POAL|nr:hypothetical protein BS78_K233500 [Paspalum vaginatum]
MYEWFDTCSIRVGKRHGRPARSARLKLVRWHGLRKGVCESSAVVPHVINHLIFLSISFKIHFINTMRVSVRVGCVRLFVRCMCVGVLSVHVCMCSICLHLSTLCVWLLGWVFVKIHSAKFIHTYVHVYM